MKFIRKVYSILAVQLSITTGAICAVQFNETARDWAINSFWLSLTACFVMVFSLCALICCFGKKVPHNYILMILFTMCEAYFVAGITAFYDRNTVIAAGATTALVAISLTIYAMTTKTDIRVFMAMVCVLYFAMLPLTIMSIFMRLPALHVFYNCMGLIFYSLFLIIDTI